MSKTATALVYLVFAAGVLAAMGLAAERADNDRMATVKAVAETVRERLAQPHGGH